MKIQKAIFSVSEPARYSSYWNMQSRLYREGLGIEPICLLFGKKSNTDMTEEYGKVIEVPIMEDLPWVPQMTWSKFDFTRTEPETTWIVGDIDLLPLSKAHFTSNIANIPDDDYVHLNAGGIASPRVGRLDGFLALGSERHGKDGGFIGSDLPAHYHVAKGKHFERILCRGMSIREVVQHMVDTDRYGMGVMSNFPKENRQMGHEQQYWYYWLAEENYSSELLWNAINSGSVNYHGLTYHNENQRVWRWDSDAKNYIYDANKAKRRGYVDIHCSQVKPYSEQASAFTKLVNLSGILR